MAAPKLIARDDLSVPLAGPLSFTDVTPGVASAAIEFQIFNDNGSGPVDTAQNPVVTVLQELLGDPVSFGPRAIEEGWLEVKALGTGSTGSTQTETDFTPLGTDRQLRLVEIGSGEWHDMEVRYNPPGTAPEEDITFFVNAEPDLRFESLGKGWTESYRDGVLTGTGETGQSYLWMQGTSGTEITPTENTVPDADVIMPDVGWTFRGVPQFLISENITFDNLDGSAVALAPGEEYWATVALGASGWVVYKSDLATSPIPTSSRVVAGTDEIVVAYVLVDDTVTIVNADITSATRARRFELLDLSSLTIAIGGGRAIVNNSLVETQVPSNLTMTDDIVNYIWLQSSNAIFSVTTVDIAPSENAYKIWEVTAAAGVITAFEDQRQEMGGQVSQVQFFFDGDITDGDTAYAVMPAHKDSYLLGVRPVVLRMDYVGANLDQGEFVIDIEKDDGAGGWTTLFTSSGTDDRRPGFAWDDTYPLRDESAAPEVYFIESGLMLRARVVEITPFNGPVPGIAESPQRAAMVLFVEVP